MKSKLAIAVISVLAASSVSAEGVFHCSLAGTTQKTASTQDSGRVYTYQFAPDMKNVVVTNTYQGKSKSSKFRLKYSKRTGKWFYQSRGTTFTVCNPENPGFLDMVGQGWSRRGIPFEKG